MTDTRTDERAEMQDKYEELKKEYFVYTTKISDLKKRLGIRSNWRTGMPLPAHIINDPWFDRYQKYVSKAQAVQNKINKLPKHKRLSKNHHFSQYIEQHYPHIFKEAMEFAESVVK